MNRLAVLESQNRLSTNIDAAGWLESVHDVCPMLRATFFPPPLIYDTHDHPDVVLCVEVEVSRNEQHCTEV